MTPDRCRQCGGDPCACARQQAFPVPATQHNYAESGMTLLDYFAGQALIAMGTWIPGPRIADSLAEVHEARARYAFDAAAAMIAERSKR